MNNLFEELFKKAKNISLSQDEKLRAQKYIMDFIEMHPVRNADPIRQRIQSPLSAFILQLRMIAVGLIVALFVGGGVSFAAEGALPGDALYPVKVNVNENVRGMISRSEESKAEWEGRRAERRLEEAAELAAENRLDTEVRVTIEEQFNAHAERAQRRIEAIETSGDASAAARISTDLEASLRAQDRILAELGESKAEVKNEVTEVQGDIRARLEAVTNLRIKAEDKNGLHIDIGL